MRALLCALAAAGASVPAQAVRAIGRPAPSFASIDGWGPLHWNMTVAAARAALAARRISSTQPPGSGATGIFPVSPAGSAAAPGTRFVEATFDRLEFTERGVRGAVEFVGGQLRSVTLIQSGVPDRAGVERIVADLVRLYGPPALHQPQAWNQNGVPVAHWTNPRSELVVTTYRAMPAGTWIVSAAYHRLPRSWP